MDTWTTVMAEHRRKLIIDCDPGHDDMAAIALAATSGAFDISAVTTVCGNAGVEDTTRNALDIVSAFGVDAPVYAGATGPLIHVYEFPTKFHGVGGMQSAGAAFRRSKASARPGHAALEIIRRVKAEPGAYTLVVLGPMTNVALALALDPSISTTIREIVFMGGGTHGGNITATAEFNIWADPEAAKMVLASGILCTMFGLNVTNEAMITRADIERVRAAVAGRNPVADILDFYASTNPLFAQGLVDGPALHDPCPIAYLIDPTLFETRALPVRVATEEGPYLGATMVDLRRIPSGDDPVINVAVGVDAGRLNKLVVSALCRAAELCAANGGLPQSIAS